MNITPSTVPVNETPRMKAKTAPISASKSLLSFLMLLFVIYLLLPAPGFARQKVRTGTIKGQVLDKYSREPLAGAFIQIVNSDRKTLTNTEGKFLFKDIPVGAYTLKFDFPETKPLAKPDIIVRSQRITFVDADLDTNPVLENQVTVNPGYFPQTKDTPGSTTRFSSEEIRRTAGSAGDISRIVSSLPSIARVNDYANSLIVRGGSPAENMFILDNIQIPNINHFPMQGASVGPISLLNADFIKDVRFLSGGFSALYGGKLSSVMDINFREGNREEFDLQFDFNFSGIGATAEGPISDKGTWMISARRSYVDLLVGMMDSSIAPIYADIQGKFTYSLSPRNKLTFLGIAGIDDNEFSREDCIEDGNNHYGETHNREGVFGVNWFSIWSDKGYSDTSISYLYTRFKDNYFKTTTQQEELKNRSKEASINLRNVNHYTFNHIHKIDFGVEAKHQMTTYDYRMAQQIDVTGEIIPETAVSKKINGNKAGAFLNYTLSPTPSLSFNLGLRGDYFSYTKKAHIAPRFSISWKLSPKTELYAATGIYHQDLPLLLLAQAPENKALKSPKAFHYTLGFSQMLSTSTRLTIEAYNKEYRNFPLDPAQPRLFVVDNFWSYQDVYNPRYNLSDTGRARSFGIEFTLQKKLKEKIYGMISGSYSSTRYRDLEGNWRNRSYDNRYIFSIEGGYKPNKSWEFSLKWLYAGGLPYTPFNLEASTAANTGIYDLNRVNGERLPAYHSLNLRVDKRFYFRGSNLIIYLSIWNVYNRKNLAGYYWNTLQNKPAETKQFGLLPILGIEFEL